MDEEQNEEPSENGGGLTAIEWGLLAALLTVGLLVIFPDLLPFRN